MPVFEYSGQLAGGQAISGTLEADTLARAREQLDRMGIEAASVAAADRMRVMRPLSHEDIVFFNQQLASLASSGIALDQGLRIVAKDLKHGRLRRVLNELASDLERGVPLEHAVEQRSAAFPPLYAEILKAGVRNNQLGATLCNINSHLTLAGAGRRLFWESALYPLIVLFLGIGLVSFFMTVLVPQLKESDELLRNFQTMDWDTWTPTQYQPPFLTRVVLVCSHYWHDVLLCAGIALAAILVLLFTLRLFPAGRCMREWLILCIPGIGSVYRTSLLARFAQGGSLAASAGQDLPNLLRLAAGTTGSAALMRDAEAVGNVVETGGEIDAHGWRLRIIPAIACYTIMIAGRRGQLAAALSDMAQTWDSLARHRLAMLRMFLVPFLIVLTAVILGAGILAMFLPLIQVVTALSSSMF